MLVALVLWLAGCVAPPEEVPPRTEPSLDASAGGLSMDAMFDASIDDWSLPDAALDVSSPDAALVPDAAVPSGVESGTLTIDSCRGVDGIAESCSAHYRVPARCSGHACHKVVVFFSGGEQRCDLPGYGMVLDAYAARGYIAACAQLFETTEAAGAIPYNDEAPRVHLAITGILASPVVTNAWNGQDLLISGISHGATAPVTAMARTTYDDAWRATRSTAACFFDGIYDLGAIDDLLGTGGIGGRPCVFPVAHDRVVGRYYAYGPFAHRCDNRRCFCNPDHSPEMDEDTIVAVDPAAFAITQLKLIECGSALAACTGDIVPAAPIAALCRALDASPAHACVFESMPTDSHLECHRNGVDRCADWFDAMAPD